MVVFYENDEFSLTKEIFNQPMFLTSNQTQLNSINPNNSYILTSNTITEKYVLVRYFSKIFNRVYSSPPSFLSQPSQTLYILIHSYIFISCRLLIPNNWKWTSIWMRLLQNLLKIVIRGCFKSLFLSWRPSQISKQLMSP